MPHIAPVRFRFAAAVCVLLIILHAQHAFAASHPAHNFTIKIRWAEPVDATTVTGAIKGQRIDSDTIVSIVVTNFNFLHYALKFVVEERTIESYALLDRIWSQVFNVAGLRAEGIKLALEADDYQKAVFEWRVAMSTAAAALSKTLETYAGKTVLTDEQCKAIAAARVTVGVDPLAAIDRHRQTVLDLALAARDPGKLDTYEGLLSRHEEVAVRLRSFVTAAGLVEHGQEYAIGQKKAGTVVTFTVSPVDARQAQAGSPFQGSYFVQSRHPLMLHVGYAAGKIDDVDFEKVRSTNGSDLFLSTQEDTNTEALVTFMSYEIWNSRPNARLGLQGVLGTSFQHPGDALYVGAGFRAGKVIFTYGGQSQTVMKGVKPVGDAVPGIDAARNLYASIAKNRDWAQFFAVSVRVY